MREAARVKRVSVIAPMWNEAAHIDGFVADIAAQDFDGELELLVADGASTDGSVERLRGAAEREGIEVTVLDNPARWVSAGLNSCIRAATGGLIVRVDCHSRYPTDYVRRCVAAAEETGAENVGGIFIPIGRTGTERAVACAMNSPFGGIHWTRHGEGERVEVDTVPYGAFTPDAFERAGLFDETLVRNQDDEFNLRLRLAGGKIVLDPAIRIFYTPRGSFSAPLSAVLRVRALEAGGDEQARPDRQRAQPGADRLRRLARRPSRARRFQRDRAHPARARARPLPRRRSRLRRARRPLDRREVASVAARDRGLRGLPRRVRDRHGRRLGSRRVCGAAAAASAGAEALP